SRPMASRPVVAVGVLTPSRLRTGHFPDPLSRARRILAAGGGSENHGEYFISANILLCWLWSWKGEKAGYLSKNWRDRPRS
ncbi:MAG: hypothetical protein WBW94_10220, partial [Anaerolineales bacterium]